MSTFDEAKGPVGHDSIKLDTGSDDCEEEAALAASNSQVSSSNVGALKPNKKSSQKCRQAKDSACLPPSQNDKANKSKPKSSQASQDDNDMDVLLISTLVGIRETVGSPIQTVAPKGPKCSFMDMLKKIPLPPDERMSVGMHLWKPEFAVHRCFLVSMGQECLERGVYTHLSGDDPAGIPSASDCD